MDGQPNVMKNFDFKMDLISKNLMTKSIQIDVIHRSPNIFQSSGNSNSDIKDKIEGNDNRLLLIFILMAVVAFVLFIVLITICCCYHKEKGHREQSWSS